MTNVKVDEEMQKMEMKMMAEMFQMMKESCLSKCIPTKIKDGDLSKAEGVCLDRCVSKYLGTFQVVGAKLNEINQSMQQ